VSITFVRFFTIIYLLFTFIYLLFTFYLPFIYHYLPLFTFIYHYLPLFTVTRSSMVATHSKKNRQAPAFKPPKGGVTKTAQGKGKRTARATAASPVVDAPIGAAIVLPLTVLGGVPQGVHKTIITTTEQLSIFGIFAALDGHGLVTIALEGGARVQLAADVVAPHVRRNDAELHATYGSLVPFAGDVAMIDSVEAASAPFQPTRRRSKAPNQPAVHEGPSPPPPTPPIAWHARRCSCRAGSHAQRVQLPPVRRSWCLPQLRTN
jgi:hypothetical protein